MPLITEAALRPLALNADPLALLIAAGGLALGLMFLYHGLRPLASAPGVRAHKMLGGAALGLFLAWAVVTAVWMLSSAAI